jgi:hypothetical protein
VSDGYGSTQATNTWIASDGSVTNYDPNTEMGFWISALHNECDRSAHLEREIERLRSICEEFAQSGTEFGTKYGSDVTSFRINENKFKKAWQKYKAVYGD